jgi:cell division protein FtsZ
MIEIQRQSTNSMGMELKIRIVGLGGAGQNALDRIQLDGLEGAELIAMNTDAQALAGSVAPVKVQLGRATTRGLGAGGDPEIGYAAAEDAADEIRNTFDGGGLVFLCAGLGGGTGSGAAPLIANLARQQHALVVAFVTMPFTFEGRRRMAQAEEALASLTEQADLVVCFENDRMGDSVSPRAGIHEAFAAADQTISQSIRAIAAMLNRRGLIRVGFDELSAALRAAHPRSIFGYGEADGDNRAHAALERALRSPLMDRGRLLADAENVLVHIAGGPSTTLGEVTLVMDELNRHIHDTTRLLFSTSIDPKLGGRLSVILLSSLSANSASHTEAPFLRPATIPHSRPEPEEEQIVAFDAAPVAPIEAPVRKEEIVPAAEVIPIKLPAEVMLPVPRPEAPAAAATPANPSAAAAKPAKTNGKPKPLREERQEQMTFEPVTRGRFEKSEPTIIDGQDLDVPAFMRMNVKVK